MKKAALLGACVALILSVGLPLFSADTIKWYRDVNEALKKADSASKPIFVDVYADWCTWCHKLDKEVYAEPRFAKYMKSFVALKVDSEDGGQGTKFAEKYQVESLPTLLVLNYKGKLINRIRGYKDSERLMQEIYAVQKLLDREKKNPEDLANAFELAREYMDRDMYSESQLRYAQIIASPRATKLQKETAQFSTALGFYRQGHLQPALTALNTYYNNYNDGASNEDALLLLSQVHIELNSNEKAIKYLREFKQKYPKSGNLARAQQVLSVLEKECPSC